MVKASKANSIAQAYDYEYRDLDEIGHDILRSSKLGLRNINLDVDTSMAGKIVQKLHDNGYKVFAKITPYDDITNLEIEW